MIPEGWRYSALEDVASVKRGKFSIRPRNDPRYFGGDTPFVQTGDVVSAQKYLTSFTQTLNEQGVAVSKVFPSGTILITIAANIGDTAITTFPVACPDSVVGIEPKFEIADVEWLNAILKTKKSDLDAQAPQNAQKNINLEVLKPLQLLTPPFPEQRRIAEILSTWDRAIETVEALIAAARVQKMALMQSLLTGKHRLRGFSDEWRSVAIGDVTQEVSERGLAHADYPVLSCSKYDGMVKSLSYFKKKVYSDDTSNYKVMRRGTFGFPSNHVEEGSIGYQDICDVGIVSPIYCVFRATDKIEDGFLYKLLKTDRYRQIFAAATNASVDRRGSLRWKEFAKIKVPLPPLDEQRAISTLIDTAELKERGLNAQRTALRQEKSALMQQLLTGKLRVRPAQKDAA